MGNEQRKLARGQYPTGIVVLEADAFHDANGNDMAIEGLEQASRCACRCSARA